MSKKLIGYLILVLCFFSIAASTLQLGKNLEADSLSVVNSAGTFKVTLNQPTTITANRGISSQDGAMTVTTTVQTSKLDDIPATVPGTVNTTDATTTVVDSIDTLTDNATHLLKVYVSAEQDDNSEGGVWALFAHVVKRAGTVTLGGTSTTFNSNDASGGRLQFSAVGLNINGGNIDIEVSGAAGRNYRWDSSYQILISTTN